MLLRSLTKSTPTILDKAYIGRRDLVDRGGFFVLACRVRDPTTLLGLTELRLPGKLEAKEVDKTPNSTPNSTAMSRPAIHKRRFLRIRLVGLLLIVTCACCLLAAWQQLVLRPYRQRQDMLHVLAQWDARVNYSTLDGDRLRRILGEDYGQIRDQIVNINIMGPRFGDNDVERFVECVTQLPHLESINLLETSVSGRGLRTLRSKLPGVRVKHATGFLPTLPAIR